MKITDVRAFVINKGNLLANASVTFDNSLVVWVKLCEGRNGHFISFPCHKYEDKDGEEMWKDDVFPLSGEFRDEITEAVLNEYNDVLDDEPKKTTSKTKKTTKTSNKRFS